LQRLIELSHSIREGMKTYPGLPEPRVEIFCTHAESRQRYQNQAEFLIANLHLCGNTGTYVDSPYHRYPEGADLAALPLERVADLPYLLVDARLRHGRAVGPDWFEALPLEGKAVLVETGWSRLWQTPAYFESNPFLTEEAARLLAARGAAFVGIDSVNIDDMEDPRRPVHTILLGAGIPVCEHMTNLRAAAHGEGRLHAVPIAWHGGATFPVRAYIVRI
jgi:kynurenine formamidase